MYEIDPKFFNENGSINYEAAMAEGRKGRSRVAYEGCGLIRDAAVQLFRNARHMVSDLYARVSSSRTLQNKAA